MERRDVSMIVHSGLKATDKRKTDNGFFFALGRIPVHTIAKDLQQLHHTNRLQCISYGSHMVSRDKLVACGGGMQKQHMQQACLLKPCDSIGKALKCVAVV